MRQDFKLTVAQKTLKYWVLYAGIAQLVERNLAKVEVASSRLVSRSKQNRGSIVFPFLILEILMWRDSKMVMQRPAKP